MHILHIGPKAQCPPTKYASGCACLNGHSILVTARNHSTSVFKSRGLLILFFFIKRFIYSKICMYILVGGYMSFSRKKGEFDRYFNRLDRPVGESRPDRCQSTQPVSISDTAPVTLRLEMQSTR